MELIVALVAMAMAALVAVSVFSKKRRSQLQTACVEVQRSMPMPTVEWVIRRTLDKVDRKALATIRAKILPRHVTVVVNAEVYQLLEPVWPRIAHDMAEELLATANAEGWEGERVTFALRADYSTGRRQVDVELSYPTSDEIPTSYAAGSHGGIRAVRVKPQRPNVVGVREWFVESPGGKPLQLRVGQQLMIGSNSDCGLVLHSNSVSRQHLRVGWNRSGSMLQVEDLGSTNGSWIGDVRLETGVPFAVTRDTWVHLGQFDRVRFTTRPAGGAR